MRSFSVDNLLFPIQNKDMNTLFSGKDLRKLIMPLIIEQLLIVLVGMADVLMVATLGEAAVSGVSLVDSVNQLILQVLFAMTAGGTVVCARFLGGKDYRKASKSGGQLLFITVTATTLIAICFIIGNRGILSLMFGKVEADVMKNAMLYMFLTSLSFPFLALYHSGAAVFRAQGDTRTSMLVSLLMNVINVAGNAFCIFILKMGVAGVGIPTVISRIIAAITILSLMQRKENPIRLKTMSDLIPDFHLLGSIFSIGVPNSVESGLFNCGKLILQSLVSTLGTASIAAYAVASNLVTYLYLPGNALGAAILTIVGQCVGAGEHEQAKKYTNKLIIVNYAMLAVLSGTLILGRHFFVGLYNLSSGSAYYAEGLLLSHCIAMIVWPLAFLYPYYFRAIGKATFTMVVAIVTMWLFRVGLAYVFVRMMHKDILWVWYAMFIDWIVRAFIYVTAFKRDSVPKTS